MERIVDEPGSSCFNCNMTGAFSSQFSRNVLRKEPTKLGLLVTNFILTIDWSLIELRKWVVWNVGFQALFIQEPQLNGKTARKVPKRLDQLVTFRNIFLVFGNDFSSLFFKLVFDDNLIDANDVEFDLAWDIGAQLLFGEFALDGWQRTDDLIHHESCINHFV